MTLDNNGMPCPKCGYYGVRYGHQKQLNPDNPNNWICGNCSEAFL